MSNFQVPTTSGEVNVSEFMDFGEIRFVCGLSVSFTFPLRSSTMKSCPLSRISHKSLFIFNGDFKGIRCILRELTGILGEWRRLGRRQKGVLGYHIRLIITFGATSVFSFFSLIKMIYGEHNKEYASFLNPESKRRQLFYIYLHNNSRVISTLQYVCKKETRSRQHDEVKIKLINDLSGRLGVTVATEFLSTIGIT